MLSSLQHLFPPRTPSLVLASPRFASLPCFPTWLIRLPLEPHCLLPLSSIPSDTYPPIVKHVVPARPCVFAPHWPSIHLHSLIPTCPVTRRTQAAGPCGDRSAAGGAASCGLVRADCPGGAIPTPEPRSAPRPKDAEHLPYTPRDREGEWATKPRRVLL